MQQQQLGKSANNEVYGFVFWITSFLCYGLYLLWAFLPDTVLVQLGVTYYPDHYWAIAVPTYICFCGCFVIVTYISINFIITEPLDSFSLITDSHSVIVEDSIVRNFEADDKLPALGDIPITVINKLLYQNYFDIQKCPADVLHRTKSSPDVLKVPNHKT